MGTQAVRIRALIIGVWMLGSFASTCLAQIYASDGIQFNRPSQSGGSQQIGGNFTALGVRDLGGRNPLLGTSQGGTSGMASLYGVKRFGSGQATAGLLPIGAQIGQSGTGTVGPFGESSLMRSTRKDMLFYAYGMGGAAPPGSMGDTYLGNALDTEIFPTYGTTPISNLPPLSQPLHTPRPERTPFQELMGMAAPPPAKPEQPVPAVSSLLLDTTATSVATTEDQALLLFRKGTIKGTADREYWQCKNCADDLSAAVRSLSLMRTINTTSALPTLLLAHAAMEQGRFQFCMANLLASVRRNPNLFKSDPDDLHQFFGDVNKAGEQSIVLDAQVRRYLREADEQPNSALAHAMSSYCAWRLKDKTRAVQLAKRAEELATQFENDSSYDIMIFGAAMKAGVR